MLASELIERTEDEWLYLGGEKRNVYDILDSDITNSQLTNIDTRARQNYTADTIIQIDYELLLIESFLLATPDVGKTRLAANERGYLESAAAAHTAGARIYLEPDYPRITILNGLKAVVGQLNGWGLWRRVEHADLTYDEVTTQSLPADTLDVKYAEARRPGPEQWDPLEKGRDYRVLKAHTPPKISFRGGGHQGQAVQLVLKQDFGSIADQNTNLDTIGIPASLQPFLPMAVAGALLRGRELTRQQIDEVKKVIAEAGTQVQVGAAIATGNDLIRTFRSFVENERRKLREQHGITRSYVGS